MPPVIPAVGRSTDAADCACQVAGTGTFVTGDTIDVFVTTGETL